MLWRMILTVYFSVFIPWDLGSPLLVTYFTEIHACVHQYSGIFIATLYVIAKPEKTKVFTEKKKMVQSLGYIHTVKLPGSENENEWMIAVDNNMDES